MGVVVGAFGGRWTDRLVEGLIVLHEDRLWRVGLVNGSRARLDPLTGKENTVTNRDKATAGDGADGTASTSFTSYGKAVNVSPNATMRVMDAGDMDETEAARYSRLTQQLKKETGMETEMNVSGAPMAKRGTRAKAVKAAKKGAAATARKAKSATPKAPRKPKAEKVQNPCKCGCGEKTGGFFVPGHDARFKGMMLKVERGEAEPTIFPKAVRDQYKFVKRGEGYVTTTNYKGESHKGYDTAAK